MLAFRRADGADRKDLFLWRNDPETVAASFVSEPVAWEDHCKWFEKSLASQNRYLYIIEIDVVPAGVLRFDVEGDVAEISITMAPHMRGRGIGTSAIAEGCKWFLNGDGKNICNIVAKVKPENIKSVGAFKSAGFLTVEITNECVTLITNECALTHHA
jgi:RimJ/RimL family protein N-acetyltransferase